MIARIRRLLMPILLSVVVFTPLFAQETPNTYLYAEKDGKKLYLDHYRPVITSEEDLKKPTILFAFGGSFLEGTRDAEVYKPWFERLRQEGYGVVSIDYRLGMVGKEYNFGLFKILQTAKNVQAAIDLAVEDMVSATSFLIIHSEELGIDTKNIVVSGSSAGALAALSTEWAICNREQVAQVLPADFNYSGLISFAGAILTHVGTPKYKEPPCPHLFFHGTKDEMVSYGKFGVGKVGILGPHHLVKLFKKHDYQFHFYRFENFGHEVANMMDQLWEPQQLFLEKVVIQGEPWSLDTMISLP